MKKFFIAEIGNNHFGRLDWFYELIDAAKYSGADAVKGQLFMPENINGSMPPKFYEDCFRVLNHLQEIVNYANKKDIPIFFSVFDKQFEEFEKTQKYKKISASQCRDIYLNSTLLKTWNIDSENTFISIPSDIKYPPSLKNAVVMHVSDYLTDNPNLSRLIDIKDFYNNIDGRKEGLIGYSDHTIGIDACMDALLQYKVNFIEKHFTLQKSMEWNGITFRDTIHGSTPEEFNDLTRRFK